jgi:hypothetical protein
VPTKHRVPASNRPNLRASAGFELAELQQQRRQQMIRSAVGTMAFAVIADAASFEAVVGSFQLETFDGMAKQ